MPASPRTVSLDQAKQWAKRLHKAAPALPGLAASQRAVAAMLGYDSWHALERAHAAAPGPTPAATSAAALDPQRVIWGVVANAGRLSPVSRPRWAHVVDAVGLGSTAAAQLCRQAGFDPEQLRGGEDDPQQPPRPAPAPAACGQCGATRAVEDHDGQPLCADCFCATEPLDDAPARPDAIASFDQTMANLVAAANARYPGLDATAVEVIANETEELEGRAEDLIEQAEELEVSGRMFFRDAMEEVLERSQVTVHAPPGHVMLRVARKDGTRCLVVVDNQAYRDTARPRRKPKR